MIAKFFGLILIVGAGLIGFSVLMMLVGTVLGLLWFALKLAIPVGLAYLGYRLLFGQREAYY